MPFEACLAFRVGEELITLGRIFGLLHPGMQRLYTSVVDYGNRVTFIGGAKVTNCLGGHTSGETFYYLKVVLGKRTTTTCVSKRHGSIAIVPHRKSASVLIEPLSLLAWSLWYSDHEKPAVNCDLDTNSRS